MTTFTERVQNGSTVQKLLLIDAISNVEVRFKWPSLRDYGEKEEGKEEERDSYRFNRHTVDFNFDAVFRLLGKDCILTKKELETLTDALKSSETFGRYDGSKFLYMIHKDEWTVRILSKAKDILSLMNCDKDVFDDLVKEMLSVPGFFRFKYESNLVSVPHVRSLLTLDNVCLVCRVPVERLRCGLDATNNVDRLPSLCSLAYLVANRYLERYYAVPMERWLAGTFFVKLNETFGGAGGRREGGSSLLNYPMHDDRILFEADKKMWNGYGTSLRTTEMYESYCPNGFSTPFRWYFDDWKLVMQTKRDVYDCPIEYVPKAEKKRLNALLNANTLLRLYSRYVEDVDQRPKGGPVEEHVDPSSKKAYEFESASAWGGEKLKEACNDLYEGDASCLSKDSILDGRLYFDLGTLLIPSSSRGSTVIVYDSTLTFLLANFSSEVLSFVPEERVQPTDEWGLVKALMELKERHPRAHELRKRHCTYLFSLKAWRWHLKTYELNPLAISKSVTRKAPAATSASTGALTNTICSTTRRDYLDGLNALLRGRENDDPDEKRLGDEMLYYRSGMCITRTCTFANNWKRLVNVQEDRGRGRYYLTLSQTHRCQIPAR